MGCLKAALELTHRGPLYSRRYIRAVPTRFRTHDSRDEQHRRRADESATHDLRRGRRCPRRTILHFLMSSAPGCQTDQAGRLRKLNQQESHDAARSHSDVELPELPAAPAVRTLGASFAASQGVLSTMRRWPAERR